MTRARALQQSWVQVRRLAEQHPEEWEGQDLQSEAPLRVFVGTGMPRRVLVVTKEAPVLRWARSDWPSGLVVVVVDGLQSRAQAAVVAGLLATGSRAPPIAFVGDADPMDLHTYLSLLVHLGAERVRFCGMCDAVLDIIDNEDAQPETLLTRELSRLEQMHLRAVESLADPAQFLGPRVSAVLRSGKKLEIEALSFRADLTPALFDAALTLASRRGPVRKGARRRMRRRPSR